MWKGFCSKKFIGSIKELVLGNAFLCQYCEKVVKKQSQKVQTIIKIRRLYKNFNSKMELYINKICACNEIFTETIFLQYRLGAVKICFCMSVIKEFYVFSWNIFHTFDIDMLQMSFTHEETLIWSNTCKVCGKKFNIIWYMKKH